MMPGSGRRRTGAPRRPRCAAAPGWSPAAMSSSAAVSRADAVQGEQAGGAGGDQRDDELVEALELAVEELARAGPARAARCGWRSRRRRRAGAAATPARRPGQPAVCLANRARRSSGPVRIRALAWLIVWVRSPRALRLATISARIASTAPSRPFGAPRARPDCAARAALTASSGSDLPCRRRSCRSERSTSTTRTPAAAMWRARPGAVAAGPFDPDQADGPEPAQPAQQAGVAGRGGRELLHAEQPADRDPARRRRACRRGCPRRR